MATPVRQPVPIAEAAPAAAGGNEKGRPEGRPFPSSAGMAAGHEQPVVEPQVSHLRQVPLRTSVMFPHSPHGSPS